MKYLKVWLPIPINWLLSFLYLFFSCYFDYIIGPDFMTEIAEYHYGYCSLAFTVTLILFLYVLYG